MERKLTAILSADVKGYSRLMGQDEEATIRTLTAYREAMMTFIHQHRGRVVDSPGDNLLAEFASAVDAVQGAVAIQKELHIRNAELPVQRQMHYRIGLNVGDVVVEGERIYGDGVNIAARIESLADGGGISISEAVHMQVENKLSLTYDYQGEQEVKNIAKPVRVYRIQLEEAESSKFQVPGSKEKVDSRAGFARHKCALIAVAGVLLLAGTIITVRYLSPSLLSPQSSALSPDAAPAALPLPDKPSIAVLPFTNMSNDPEQEHFSDGMSDTLITDLSKVSGLFVIARNSTFVYKGKATNIQQVSQELGVRYVVEGSVQRVDNKVRINAQLVDAVTGHHVWAERYDREMKDIFALQDEITQKVVAALEVKLTMGEQEQVWHRYTDNVEAYDYYLRGMEYFWRATKDMHDQARQMFTRAIALDPQFALAYAWLGLTYLWEWSSQWSADPHSLEQALAFAQKALALDDALPLAHSLSGNVYVRTGQPEQALAEGARAIVLAPNDALAHAAFAEILLHTGRAEEAIEIVEKAMRLDPQSAAFYSTLLGGAYRLLGRYEEAIAAQKRVLTRNPDYLSAHVELVIAYYALGRVEEAQAAEAQVLRLNPKYSLEGLRGEATVKAQQEAAKRLFPHSLTDNLTARAYFYGGFAYFFRSTREANARVQKMWAQAIELDPQFAAAHTLLAGSLLSEWTFQWSHDPQTLERAYILARRAVALDDSSPLAHQMLANVYLLKKQHEQALVEAERAIALDPEDGDGYLHLGTSLLYARRTEEAITALEKGERLHPRSLAALLATLGRAYSRLGRYTEALDALNRALPLNPHWLLTHVALAVTYSELDRMEEAGKEVSEILRLSPNFSLEGLRQTLPYKDPADIERVLAALRKAGLK